MSLLAALIFLASPPAASAQSEFVDPEHEHQWVMIEDREDGGFVSFDAAFQHTITLQGNKYPVALIRYLNVRPNGWWGVGEVISAFDCQQESFVNVSIRLEQSDVPEVYRDIGPNEDDSFGSFDFPEPGRTALIEHVCGADSMEKGT